MKKAIFAAILITSALGAASSVHAALFTAEHVPATFTRLSASDPKYASSYAGEFNLLPSGYVPGMEIDSAKAEFTFTDLDDSLAELVSIDLGSVIDFISGTNIPLSPLRVSFGSYLSATLISELQTNGKIGFVITADRGDFVIKKGTLIATVPDSASTLALLALGLVAIGFARRK